MGVTVLFIQLYSLFRNMWYIQAVFGDERNRWCSYTLTIRCPSYSRPRVIIFAHISKSVRYADKDVASQQSASFIQWLVFITAIYINLYINLYLYIPPPPLCLYRRALFSGSGKRCCMDVWEQDCISGGGADEQTVRGLFGSAAGLQGCRAAGWGQAFSVGSVYLFIFMSTLCKKTREK